MKYCNIGFRNEFADMIWLLSDSNYRPLKHARANRFHHQSAFPDEYLTRPSGRMELDTKIASVYIPKTCKETMDDIKKAFEEHGLEGYTFHLFESKEN